MRAGASGTSAAAGVAAALATFQLPYPLTVANVFSTPSSHYPVFHQMEGVRLFPESEMASHIGGPVLSGETGDDPELQRRQREHTLATSAYIARDLKDTLSGTPLVGGWEWVRARGSGLGLGRLTGLV